MSGSRKSNTRISKLHERALRIMYNDYETLFSDLLGNDDSLVYTTQTSKHI